MRQTANPSDDLFLSLAMNDTDAGDGDAPFSSHQTRAHVSSVPQRRQLGLRERAPSNESLNASRLAELRAAQSPTPVQHPETTARTPLLRAAMRKPRYAIGTATSSSFEAAAREWNASPDVLKFPPKRQPAAVAEATPRQRRMYRVGKAYETTNGSRNLSNLSNISHHLSQGLVTPTMSPKPSARKKSDAETESIDSANAPSTVWDELDDLKSRIRSLEIGGKAPSPSAATAANQSFERPRTATTAPTTISSSPKHARKQSSLPTESNYGAPATASLHPLLHDALANAKSVLSPQLYRSLEATATDALALAAMTASNGPQGTTFTAASMVNGASVPDRHIRRKADNMCRNLTDLCIALCDGRSDLASPTIKASPLNVSHRQGETPSSRYARRMSMGPADLHVRTSPSRSMSRLDNRRSSLLGLGLGSTSPAEANHEYYTHDSSPSHDQTDYAARYSRPGTSLQHSRYSQVEDEAPQEPPSRAPSRAMTDLGHKRQPSSRRSEYGAGTQHSPSLRETLAARRATAGIPEEDGQYTPSQSASHEAARRILERRAALQLEESSYVPKRRRIASLTQYSPLSPRIGSEPVRTSSLSRRRNLVVE